MFGLKFAGERSNGVIIFLPQGQVLLHNELICCAVENIYEKLFMAGPAALRYTQTLNMALLLKLLLRNCLLQPMGADSTGLVTSISVVICQPNEKDTLD